MMKQKILIVGISGSIGRTLASHFGEDPQNEIYGTTSKINQTSGNLLYLDLMQTDSIDKFPDHKWNHVIISSGYEPSSNLQESTETHIEKMFRIHVIGVMLFIKRIQSHLASESTITLFSSPAAWQGSYDPSYAAVKGATNALVRTLAKDLSPTTRVNGFSPSLIEGSTVFKGMTNDFQQKHIERTLNKRLLTLEECSIAFDFILKSKHYTGQILHLNGGMIYG